MNQRYRVLSTARQNLFQPDSPVWVCRYQLSRGCRPDRRWLQVRMVNCDHRTISRVFLRVVCFDARRTKLCQLEMVPIEAENALPGKRFGEDRPVELFLRGAVYAEVFPQRIRFADGSAWDETEPQGYLAFAPEPVRATDPRARELAARARAGGVQNRCHFRLLPWMWVCTCGMPNSLRTLGCVHCGADRLWLAEHMVPGPDWKPAPPRPRSEPIPIPPEFLLDPVPQPEDQSRPEPPEQAPGPEPEALSEPVTAEAQPPQAVEPPLEVLPLPPRPIPEPEAPPRPAPPKGLEKPPAPPVKKPLPLRLLQFWPTILAVLLILGLFLFVVFQGADAPAQSYREALSAQAAGDYDRAAALLERLGDYRDSPALLREVLLRQALDRMNEGAYLEALALFEQLGDRDREIADCIYALSAAALNAGDPDRALEYADWLRRDCPEDRRAEALQKRCAYQSGNLAAAQAAEETDLSRKWDAYERARRSFLAAGDYADSADRAEECLARLQALQAPPAFIWEELP